MLGVPHVVSCANGTDALLVALQAVGVKRGMKVALPNLTFWATFEAVAQLGAVPVLVDIDPDDLHVSLDELRAAHDAHRFEALMLVHLFGWTSSRLLEIRAFCKERSIALVEDGAQCFGVEAFGKPVLADAGSRDALVLSRQGGGRRDGRRRHHHAVEGARDVPPLHLQPRSLRSLFVRARRLELAHGRPPGGVPLARARRAARDPRVASQRPRVGTASASPGCEARQGGPRLRSGDRRPGIVENGYLNVLTVEGKRGQDVVDALKAKGIGAARTYPETMDVQPPAKAAGAIAHGDLQRSKAFCEKVVNLPLFFGIREDEREAVIAALSSVL